MKNMTIHDLKRVIKGLTIKYIKLQNKTHFY